MQDSQLKSARAIAFETLNKFDKLATTEHIYLAEILSPMLSRTTERQRATDLVFGSIRNRDTIDTVIAKLTDCPPARTQSKIRNIIRIGAYELIYCPATAQYAIVNEASENAAAIAGKKQVGFVNALLRQLERHIADRCAALLKLDTQTIPQSATKGCKFDCPILPDPQTAPADYFSAAFSIPKWLTADWLSEYGPEKVSQICFASNRRPSIYIRPNPLKTTVEKLTELFHREEIDFETTPDKSMMKIKSPRAVTDLPGFSEGLFTIQDLSASQAVRLLNPQAGWKILDLCAAPGTKTIQLAEQTGDKAEIFATDISRTRLKKVKENISRLSVKSVSIISYGDIAESGPFDAVLVDVPCSNTGVFSKRPEVRYRITPYALHGLAKTQAKLLQSAACLLKPDGKICYSTCSIQRNENDLLIKSFLTENPCFKLETQLLTLPAADDFDRDGAYTAIIIGK